MTGAKDDLAIAAERTFQRAFAGIIKIESDDIELWVNGLGEPPVITKKPLDTSDPVCIWSSASDTMRRVLEGERALESAYISGRLKISGDMSIMTRLEMENIR